MYQSTSIGLDERGIDDVALVSFDNAAVPFHILRLRLGDFGGLSVSLDISSYNVERLLSLCRSVEQAARAWQMERDGVSADDAAKVLTATDPNLNLTPTQVQRIDRILGNFHTP